MKMNPYNLNVAITEMVFSKHRISLWDNKLLLSYCGALLIVAMSTLIGNILFPYINSNNLIMLYLLGVVAVTHLDSVHKGPSIVAALLSTLAFDFFFIEPYLSFAVSDTQYIFTLLVMLTISQLICHLNLLIKKQSESTHKAKLQVDFEKMRNLLLTSISHDLRTPLTAIMGSASILLQVDNTSADMSAELLKNIFDESKRLNQHVTNILQMIRLESRSVKMNKRSYFAEDIIENALERLTESIAERAIELNIDAELPAVFIDPMLIQQVMVNLIENAIKYSPSGFPIGISARLSQGKLIIKIADRGMGLDTDELQNIFNQFYRCSNSTHADNGFGLGLPICKNIIEMHGGTIWAQNRIGGGAIFYFSLPLKDERCVEQPASLLLRTA